MNKNKVLIKAIVFLLAGITVALVFTLTPESYSWFNRYFNGPSGDVVAASTEDIIAEIGVVYDGDIPMLKLKKAKDLDYSPIIFFSIEGEIEEYVLHIDAVKLEDEIDIPIVPNLNIVQATSLILSGKNEFQGKIRIKHLNEFINESIDITLSKSYLIAGYLNMELYKAGLENLNISKNQKDELIKLIKDSIIYTENYIRWDNTKWKEYSNQPESSVYFSLPMGKVELSDDQDSIINLVTPGLLGYIDKIYSISETLMDRLNIEIEKNAVLALENEELLGKVKILEEEKIELNGEIDLLEEDNLQLNEKIRLLEKEKIRLDNKITGLEEENYSLNNRITRLKEENGELNNIIVEIREGRRELNNYIMELEHRIQQLLIVPELTPILGGDSGLTPEQENIEIFE